MARAEQGTGALERRLVPTVDLSPAPGTPADGDVGPSAGVAPSGQDAVLIPGARVELRLPADPAFLSVLRTTTAALAVRLDVTVDAVEDVRMAVDEAASLVLGAAATPGAFLDASFAIGGHELVVEVRGPARSLPDRGSVAWALLDALVEGLEVLDVPQGSALRLVHETTGGAP